MTKNSEYRNQWIAKAYDRINLTVSKGKKNLIQEHAATHDESVNAFINRAISETMERDEEKANTNHGNVGI